MTEHVSTAHIAFHNTLEIVHKADHKLQAKHHWMNCNEETRVCNFTEDTCTESSRNIAFSTQCTPLLCLIQGWHEVVHAMTKQEQNTRIT